MKGIILRYAEGHRRPLNRACHAVAIPLLAVGSSQAAFQWSLGWHTLAMAVAGVAFLGIVHGLEGNRPVVLAAALEAVGASRRRLAGVLGRGAASRRVPL